MEEADEVLNVEPIELEMGIWGLRINFKRDGIDYSMNVHETRNGRHAAAMARMLEERIYLAIGHAVEKATASPE